MQKAKLKRDISTTNILVASAGGMVGSGWLFSPYITAQMAGGNALIAWIIATIFMMLIALPLCELGTMFPISGGLSNYPTFTHGREVGFLFAWTSWLSFVVITPIEIQAILQYASHFFPSLVVGGHSALTLSAIGYCAAAVIMVFLVVLNSYGIKFLAECTKYTSIIKFILPSIAVFALLYTAPNFDNVQLQLSSTRDWSQIFKALSAGGVVFAFAGFQNGLMLAGEVKNPKRNIPIAILGAVLIGFFLYLMLQLSFIAAIPKEYLAHGWQALTYPGDSGPLVGLTLLLGLGVIATMLLIDASISPFGTALIYTAATSRIMYGMALNHYLPDFFKKVNRHNIPYVTIYANAIFGMFSFLPFPGWQKLVAFISSACVLTYGIGPICILAMRKLKPDMDRPFKLPFNTPLSYLSFYVCNLMLFWCGFDVLYKLGVALLFGLTVYLIYNRKNPLKCSPLLYWFILYISSLIIASWTGTYGGIGLLQTPYDFIVIFIISVLILWLSQMLVKSSQNHTTWCNLEELAT